MLVEIRYVEHPQKAQPFILNDLAVLFSFCARTLRSI
jgi:hypothetical protein